LGPADQWISEIPVAEGTGVLRIDPSKHQNADKALLDNVISEIRNVDILVALRTPDIELKELVETKSPRLTVCFRYTELPLTKDYPELDFSDHILVRWQRLLNVMNIRLNDRDIYRRFVPPKEYRGYTIVHVGAGSPKRLWPLERWSAVVTYLESKRHRVVLTGSNNERLLVAKVREATKLSKKRDRSGATGIMELAYLVAGAQLVLSVDTGISHLATCFQRPSITLFGPNSPNWWGPPPGSLLHKTLWSGKCGDSPYGSEPDSALLELLPTDVIETVEDMENKGLLDL
jgi:hypothetical protein